MCRCHRGYLASRVPLRSRVPCGCQSLVATGQLVVLQIGHLIEDLVNMGVVFFEDTPPIFGGKEEPNSSNPAWGSESKEDTIVKNFRGSLNDCRGPLNRSVWLG